MMIFHIKFFGQYAVHIKTVPILEEKKSGLQAAKNILDLDSLVF